MHIYTHTYIYTSTHTYTQARVWILAYARVQKGGHQGVRTRAKGTQLRGL